MKLYWTPLLLLMAFTITSVNAAPSGRIFVTNERGNTLSVINGETLEVEATIDIGERPRGVGLSPDGTELYVAVSEENKIVVVDPNSLKILRDFEAGSDPEAFAVHPNGNIYISNEDDAKATVFDPKTGKQIAEIRVGLEPEGVAISPDGKRVIVTSESTNMLHVIKAPENIIENNILIGSRPRAATFSQSGDIAYATAEISGEVVKVDMNSAKIIKTGTTGDSKSKPKDVILSKDEKVIYVAGGRANKVVVMDANTLEIIKGIPVGKRVWGLAISKDGKRVFSTDGVSGTVSVIDTNKNEVIKTIDVGEFPWGVVIND
jgi:PQQ-dependent catabolism-associated beta-propeller protein